MEIREALDMLEKYCKLKPFDCIESPLLGLIPLATIDFDVHIDGITYYSVYDKDEKIGTIGIGNDWKLKRKEMNKEKEIWIFENPENHFVYVEFEFIDKELLRRIEKTI